MCFAACLPVLAAHATVLFSPIKSPPENILLLEDKEMSLKN